MFVKLSEAPCASTIQFKLEGKNFKGINYRDLEDNCKVYVLTPPSGSALLLSPDMEVEILQPGGFTLTLG